MNYSAVPLALPHYSRKYCIATGEVRELFVCSVYARALVYKYDAAWLNMISARANPVRCTEYEKIGGSWEHRETVGGKTTTTPASGFNPSTHMCVVGDFDI